jgi:hypothetical protein
MWTLMAIAVFAPLQHGSLGVLDEVELCLTPIVVVITVLAWRILSARSHAKSARPRSRPRAAERPGKKPKNH